jgi:hypothetical protein
MAKLRDYGESVTHGFSIWWLGQACWVIEWISRSFWGSSGCHDHWWFWCVKACSISTWSWNSIGLLLSEIRICHYCAGWYWCSWMAPLCIMQSWWKYQWYYCLASHQIVWCIGDTEVTALKVFLYRRWSIYTYPAVLTTMAWLRPGNKQRCFQLLDVTFQTGSRERVGNGYSMM